MYTIKYILVQDAGRKDRAGDARHRFIPHVGHCLVVEAAGLSDGVKLLDQLVKLRKHWPDAKILGVSELDPSACHAPVRVNPWMNALRRELSDME